VSVAALLGFTRAGFMNKVAETANKMFDDTQKEFIDGVPVYPVNQSAAQQISYYDWQN
jgi:hypothetical protein